MYANNKQKQIIKMLQKRLGMDDSAYREFLSSFNASSSKELSESAASEAIGILKRLGVEQGVWRDYGLGKPYEHLSGRPDDFATPRQLRMIAGMWAEVSFQRSAARREQALKRFLQNRFGVMGMEQLMKTEVERVVRALEAMKRQMNKKDKNGGCHVRQERS